MTEVRLGLLLEYFNKFIKIEEESGICPEIMEINGHVLKAYVQRNGAIH